MVATLLVACNDDETPDDAPPACTAHTDANTDGKCDTCGADVAVKSTGSVMMDALTAQLDAAKSMKLNFVFDMELGSTVVGSNEGDSFGQTLEADLVLSRTENGVNLVLTTKTVGKGASDLNAPATPMLYLVDNVLYVYTSDEQTFETGYVKVPLENDESVDGAKANLATMLTELLAQCTELLDGIEMTAEQYAEIGEALVELLNVTGNKGSVKLDIKSYYDRFKNYVLTLDHDTKTLRAVLNDALALIDEDLTADKLIAKIQEYGSLTVAEAMDKIDAWLTKEYNTNLQKIYDEALANAKVKEMLKTILPVLQPGDWDFEEEYAKLVAFRLTELKESAFGSATLYEVVVELVSVFAPKADTAPMPAPEGGEPVPYTDEDPDEMTLPTLEELIAEVNTMLDMTLTDLADEYETAADILEFVAMCENFALNECYLSADVSFKGVFMLDTLTLKAVLDATHTGQQVAAEGGAVSTVISSYKLSATLTLSEISTSTVTITAPTNILG